MVRQYTKGVAIKIGRHFTTTEFDCHCSRTDCTVTLIDDLQLESLDLLRDLVGALKILSGFRCRAHNDDPNVGGSPNSQHPLGKASDVRSVAGRPPRDLAKVADEKITTYNRGGIGIYDTFVHLDVRGRRARWNLAKKSSS